MNVDKKIQRLQAENKKLKEMIKKDLFTNLYNKAHALKVLSRRQNSPSTAVIELDIDHFKTINDTYGHDVGDLVIKDIATVILSVIRKKDLAFRFGGEEFLIVCPNTTIVGATILGEKIRTAIEKHILEVQGNMVKYTSSVGVGTTMKEADTCLYRAKASGRNIVCNILDDRTYMLKVAE